MQSLPAHERRAPIEARWARLGPRVEAALALNCDALTRACLIDSIVRGGVRDGVNLSNEGLLEVYLARQSSGVRARGLSGCLPRVVQAHATTLHVLLSRQPQRTLAAADAAFREARSSDSRARIPREKAVANPIYLPLRAGFWNPRRAHAGRRRDPVPKPARDSRGVRRRHGRDAARVRQFAAGLGRKFGCGCPARDGPTRIV